MVNLGPIIFGLLFGLVVGSRLRFSEYFNNTSLLAVLILSIVLGWLYGAFPYYTDFQVSTGFISAVIGLFICKLTVGRKNNSNK